MHCKALIRDPTNDFTNQQDCNSVEILGHYEKLSSPNGSRPASAAAGPVEILADERGSWHCRVWVRGES